MKKTTKQKILKNEIANKLKRKKNTIKTKKEKAKEYSKTKNLNFNLSGAFVDIQANYFKTITLNNKQIEFKNKNKSDILASELTPQEKQTLLAYQNKTIVNLKDVDKTIKNNLKEYCLKVLKDNLKNVDSISKTTLFITDDDKSELTNMLKSILQIDYNFTFNQLKSMLLAGYGTKLNKNK